MRCYIYRKRGQYLATQNANLNLESLARNLTLGSDGIYYSDIDWELSYPEDGNEIYYQLEDKSFWFNHRNKVIHSLVRKYGNEGVLFDIGGGNGFVSKGLQEKGIRTILFEPGISGARHAKKRGVDEVVCATIEDAGFAEGSIENVGLFDVVEHIENDFEFLQNIYKLQKSGSKIFISVPAYDFLWSQEDITAGHFRRFTLKKMQKLLERVGYEIEFKSYFFAFLPLPIFVSRSIPYILGMSKEKELKDYQKDHGSNSVLTKLVSSLLSLEVKLLSKGMKVPFGSSCVVVGRKKREAERG